MSYIKDNYKLLTEIAKLIAEQNGPTCEVVLHDLTLPYDQTVVAIYNGHVTGRKLGDGGTNAGLEILKGTASPDDQYGYINTLPNGRILRSSSKYFKDESGKVIGSLCINQDITELIHSENIIHQFVTANNGNDKKEHFSGSIDELLDQMMLDETMAFRKDVDSLTKEERVKIVNALNAKGFFLIKKAPEKLASFLGTSRFSIYNYLNEDSES